MRVVFISNKDKAVYCRRYVSTRYNIALQHVRCSSYGNIVPAEGGCVAYIRQVKNIQKNRDAQPHTINNIYICLICINILCSTMLIEKENDLVEVALIALTCMGKSGFCACRIKN